MEYSDNFIISICEEMLRHPDRVQVVEKVSEDVAARFNAERCGSLDIVVNGLTFEIHEDHWELWDSDDENVVPEYGETSPAVVEKIREVVKTLTADPNVAEAIGFTDIVI